jgi:hypothetical protein
VLNFIIERITNITFLHKLHAKKMYMDYPIRTHGNAKGGCLRITEWFKGQNHANHIQLQMVQPSNWMESVPLVLYANQEPDKEPFFIVLENMF